MSSVPYSFCYEKLREGDLGNLPNYKHKNISEKRPIKAEL